MSKCLEAMCRNLFASAIFLLSFIFLLYNITQLPSVLHSFAGVVIGCGVLVVSCVVMALDAYKAVLAKLLEPKCGYGVASCSTVDMAAQHRMNLEMEAIKGLSSQVAHGGGGVDHIDLAQRMRESIDGLLSVTDGNFGHSVSCLYEYTLARLNLKDTPEMRILFWDAHGALQWAEGSDKLMHPVFAPEACAVCNPLNTQPPEPKGAPCMATDEPVESCGGATAPEVDGVEAMIQDKGKTAPRVTPADIEANIDSEHYFTAGEGVAGRCYREVSALHSPHVLELLTFCVLVLKNGFTVTGESACASPENFDAEIGRKIARQNAVQKIWPLMGYELRTQLARPVLTEADAQADCDGVQRPDNHVG